MKSFFFPQNNTEFSYMVQGEGKVIILFIGEINYKFNFQI